MKKLWPGKWTRELVVNNVRFEDEVPLIERAGVTVTRLNDIVTVLNSKKTVVSKASGADLVDLIHMGYGGK